MTYTTSARRVFNQDKNIQEKGIYKAKIVFAKIGTTTWVSDTLKEIGINETKQISFKLETVDLAEPEIVWGRINQFFHDDTASLRFNTNDMDNYSGAVGIPVNTNFKSVEEWVDYMNGKELYIDVEISTKGNPYIKNVLTAEEAVELQMERQGIA